MKGDNAPRRSSFGSIMRRRLSDITNSIPQPKSPSVSEKLAPDAASAKDFVDHLVKEKMGLVKLVQEKNKIIELSGVEIRNLKNCLQKMHLQNWSLAQANSHMLAELSLGKQRLKALQHEVMCKEAILKAKNSQLKEQEQVNVRKPEFQEPSAIHMVSESSEDAKTCKAGRRGRSTRSQSLGSSTTSYLNVEKDATVRKRHCVRRQSARSRIAHEEPTDDKLFEIDEAKFLSPAVPSNSPTSEDSCVRRSSIGGRPLRRAAEKVQSYKERPVNVKMRRQ